MAAQATAASAASSHSVDLPAVQAAAERVGHMVHRTPVMTCSTLDQMSGYELHFKCEVFQKSGAFKIRGACNAVMSLSEGEAAKGVITHSSGNHGGAVALAAKLRGIAATVVVPEGTPACKTDAIQGYGGKVVVCEPTMDGREKTCEELMASTGAVFIHPYNDPRVIAGQGTIALELLEQVHGLDALVVPVSGGGMISGIAVAAKALQPSIQIIAAEPLGRNDAADVQRCKAAGELLRFDRPETIADGLQGRLGSNTWPVVRDLVHPTVVTVSEAEIVAAMRLCYERMKVVVEPSGAVGLAAALSPSFPLPKGSRLGVILCGGNVDLAAKGLWEAWPTG
eukprot:jgi/Tetstr1/461499/TSEL_006605.t1